MRVRRPCFAVQLLLAGFGAPAFCDVAKDEHAAHDLAVHATNRRRAVVDRRLAAVARDEDRVIGETDDHAFA